MAVVLALFASGCEFRQLDDGGYSINPTSRTANAS